MASRTNNDWLHLFTSTIRPLYISDALDLLATPAGSIVRFRYEQKYVAPSLRDRWETKGALSGTRVLVHFAIQHPAEYHLPAYLPLREATVTRHFVEGRDYIINFSTGPIRLLAGTRQPPDGDDGAPVRAFSETLRTRLDLLSPESRPSATIAASQADLLEPIPEAAHELQRTQGQDFESLVRLLAQALYFAPRIYYRVSRIEKQDNTDPESLSNGRLILVAGQRYTISIAHYQNQPPPEGTRLTVSTPEGLTLLGDPDLVLPSRYDVIPVEVYADYRDDKHEGQLSITVASPALGPTVRIPIIIQPSVVATVVGPTLGVAGGAAATVASLLASGQGLKIGLATGGAALAGGALMYRRSKRLS